MVSIAYVIIVVVFGLGMTGSFISPDTRFELFDFSQHPPSCEIPQPEPEPGAIIPGKGKASTLSSNVELVCRRKIFSSFERNNYVDFVAQNAPRQARRSAHALMTQLDSAFADESKVVRQSPVAFVVSTRDDRLKTLLEDVFQSEFAAVFGEGSVSHQRFIAEDPSRNLLVRVKTREVDVPDLLFDVNVETTVNGKKVRWNL